MSRLRVYEKEGLLTEQTNPELWPTVDELSLNEKHRLLFIKRKQAVMMYFKSKSSMAEIHQETGVDPQTLRRVIKRCMSLDEYGVVLGFRALIPYKKVKPYELNPMNTKRNKSRKSGEFSMLLMRFPDIKDLIDELFLGRHRRTLEPAMRTKSIHKKMIDACRKKDIPLSEYPFNTKHMGYRALERYLNRLASKYFGKSVSRYGHDAVQKAKNTGEGEQNHPSTLTPYQKVQFDAHRIDGFFVINLKTPEEDDVTVVLDRFWILTIIDVATRIILGYAISLNKEYSAADVMHCVRNCIMPHEKINLTIDGLTYHDIGGYPSEVYPETKWAVWDVICFDNAKSHLANLVKDRLKNLVGCTINLGPVDLPMRRGIIERFFKILEETGFHRLPNTTGSNPDDPRRTNPEENAIKWNITYDHLKEMIDVMISNYNGTPHGGIYHQSPLELLGKRLQKGLYPHQLNENNRSEVLFMHTKIKRIIRGSNQSGKKPYVQYEGVEYRSEKLSNSAHLIGQELLLHVNVDDLRTIKAYEEDGSEFGYLTAVGKWSFTPHSLQTRKAINSLVHRKLIHYTTWDDPVFIYTEYLMNKARKGRKGASNKITNVQEVAKNNRKTGRDDGEAEALAAAEKENAALEKARELSDRVQQVNEMDRYQKMLSKLKTHSF
ncbi:hypothetical protein MKZ15_11870 [Paenibacillus sp. FSL R7-0216]|uniref:hypothetical protein n=1 Tax=Paenibacillus sp. FSL R7-0216 TaxID=2921677 RepID=UPI0030DDAA96